jgi:hypothetical protein
MGVMHKTQPNNKHTLKNTMQHQTLNYAVEGVEEGRARPI